MCTRVETGEVTASEEIVSSVASLLFSREENHHREGGNHFICLKGEKRIVEDRQVKPVKEHLLIPIVIPWKVNVARYHTMLPSSRGILLHESTKQRTFP